MDFDLLSPRVILKFHGNSEEGRSPWFEILSMLSEQPLAHLHEFGQTTSRSRGVSDSYCRRKSASFARRKRADRSESMARRTASKSSCSRNGLVRNSTAPDFMA